MAATAFNMGCKPESSSNKPSFIINADNAQEITENTLDLRDAAATDFTDVTDISNPNAMPGRYFSPREMFARISESRNFDCSISGSTTITATVPDDFVSEDTMPASGSMEFSVAANNCVESDGTTDGTTKIAMSWSGFDGTTSFDSLSSKISFKDLTITDESGEGYMDGDIEATVTNDSVSMSWDIFMTGPETGGKGIHTFTTTDLTGQSSDGFLSAGAWRVEGGEDTFIAATVVANGVEVVTNGGQAELHTWAELNQ